MAKNVVVVGTQWGDEGKGKIVDWLTDHAKGVVRFQGGHNAGHTLVIGENVYKLQPGARRASCATASICYIGNGVVLDIHHLLSEIAELEERRHRRALAPEDQPGLPADPAVPLGAGQGARGRQERGDNKIGTTGKGIGPTYEDKVARRALRVYDLFHPERFADKLTRSPGLPQLRADPVPEGRAGRFPDRLRPGDG